MIVYASTKLSEDALYEICRALADRGEDYGWNVYYKGTKISAWSRRKMLAFDENAQAWLDAFDFSLGVFKSETGKEWRY
jgi:hypothetical protein